jgi:lysozyme
MTQGEFDAYTSLAFNVGHGGNGRDGVCRNRHNQPSIIVRKLRAGDYAGACEAIELFNRAGGRVLPGLQKRRAHERALCEGRK